MAAPWFIRHAPRSFSELLFANDVHLQALKWLKGHRDGGVLHITGGSGTGKSALVHAIAKAQKMNVLEITESLWEELPTLAKTRVGNLNGLPTLLCMDESAIRDIKYLVRVIRHAKVPLIITSAQLRLRDFLTLRIEPPRADQVIKRLESTASAAAKHLKRTTAARIAERCGPDVRAAVNYAQLFASVPDGSVPARIVERTTDLNIFQKCAELFKRRVRFAELEELHSAKLSQMCFNSLLGTAQDHALLFRAAERRSEAAALPAQYAFLELEPFSRHQGRFSYVPDDAADCDCSARPAVLHYVDLLAPSRNNSAGIRHLGEIIDYYKLEELREKHSALLAAPSLRVVQSSGFRYKFTTGSSNPVRRDISLREILDL